MDDPFESRLRSLMKESGDQCGSGIRDERRLGRVLHRAHIRGGLFDVLSLFKHWGWVITEGGARGLQQRKPRRDPKPRTSRTTGSE